MLVAPCYLGESGCGGEAMRLNYAVVRFEDGWKVVSGQRRIGHYATSDLALSAGARLALEARDAGHEVEFLVQQPDAELIRTDPAACVGPPAGSPAQPLPLRTANTARPAPGLPASAAPG